MSSAPNLTQLPSIPAPELVRLLEVISDAFYTLDQDWNFTYLNSHAIRLIAGGRDLVGKNVWKEFPTEASRSKFKMYYTKVMEERIAVEFQEYAPSLGRWYEVRAYPSEAGGVMVFFRDITDRRESQARLRMLAAVVEYANDFIGISTPDLKPFFVNEAGKRMVGLRSDEEVRRTNVLDYFYPDDLGIIREQAIPTLERTGHWSGEVRFRNFQTEEPIHTMWNVFAINDDGGNTIAWATISPNLGALRQAREALRKSEEQFRALVNAMPQIVWTATPEGTQDFANRRWYEFTGLDEGSMEDGEPWRRIAHPDDIPDTEKAWADAVKKREPYSHIHRIRDRAGHYRWILSRALPQFNEDDRVVRWLGTGTDITDVKQAEDARREAEKALRESEERSRIATSAADLGIFDWDLNNNSINCSPRVLTILGFDANATVSVEEMAATLHPDDRARREALIKVAFETGTEYDAEYRVIWPDGSVRWISTRGRADYENGKPSHFRGVVADVTARKEMEEALIRSEKLASVGRMAATIAHEINNPLAAVTNLLYLISYDDQLSDKVRGYLTTAQQELHRAAHITKQTLGFYRESGRPSLIDVHELVGGVLELYAPRLANKNILVDRRFKEGLRAYAIPGELRQVVSNLLSNAIDAVPENNARLLIRTGTGTAFNGQRMIRISIADNGHGMNTDLQKRIFEPFFTTKVSVGTGLGLWVSRNILSRGGGRIRVKSGKGRGAVFSILLPAQAPDPIVPELPT